MKNTFLLLLLISGLVGFSSCKDDETSYGTLTLNVKAEYDGQPLKTFTTHPFDNGEQIQFSLISLLMSDIELVRESFSTRISRVELADMSFDNDTEANQGYVIQSMEVPTGTYSGLRFGIGVTPDLNSLTPSDFPSDNPLSNTSYYWVPWGSYIFSKTEGLLDSLGNSTFDLGFALHTGSDPLFVELEGSSLSILIEDQKETSLDIVVDYKELLSGIDIKKNPLNHNPEDLATITALVNNYATAITLRQ